MKKYILILVALIYSCSSEPNFDRLDFVGLWASNPGLLEGQTEQVTTYNFGEDGTLEVLTIYQSIDDEMIGYLYRATGLYFIDGNDLIMNMERIYQFEGTNVSYVETVDDLILTQEQWSQSVEVSFSNDENSMTFDYGPCNDTGNCIGSQTLSRLD